MGNFKVVVEAVGGHGCQREVKSGDFVKAYCGQANCPDCLSRKFVEDMKRIANVSRADLIHWANADGTFKRDTVVDNLGTLQRAGSFGIAYDAPGNESAVGTGPEMDWSKPLAVEA